MKKENNTVANYKHISAKHKLIDLKLGEVWRYRDLILLFTKRTYAVRYKQTILGPLWIFITPMLTSIMHLIVFGNIAKLGTDGIPQILFYFASTAIWSFFSDCVTNNASTFIDNARLFGKVYFPRLTVPISNVISNLIKFGIQMIMVVGIYIYFLFNGMKCPNPLNWLFIIPILVLLGIMGMSVGVIISSLTTKYRDLTVLVSFGISLWMYGTPVVYPLSQLNDTWYTKLILINPVTSFVEAFRYCLFGHGQIMTRGLIWSILFTVVAAFAGLVLFNRVERNFLDTV